jgi:hypothetical protein
MLARRIAKVTVIMRNGAGVLLVGIFRGLGLTVLSFNFWHPLGWIILVAWWNDELLWQIEEYLGSLILQV